MIAFHFSRAGYDTFEAEELDKISGLGGADDYVTKPFSPRELIACIEAVLRRSRAGDAKPLKAGVINLDAAGHRVSIQGMDVAPGSTE